MSATLGRLTKVDLRTVWTREAGEFTPWLAQDENLRLLGEALGIELALVQSEKGVGAFSCDILAKDTATDAYVVIENQLEQTDHGHLGQLLTYAAGVGALTIIWVCKTLREEHRQALDWLNANTGEDVAFFGVEVELWRIGDSPVAPTFNVVSKPNSYQRMARHKREGDVSEGSAGHFYLQYFTALREYLAEKAPHIRTMKPRAQHWTNISIGKGSYHIRVIAGLQRKALAVDFVAYDDPNKIIAAALESRKDEIQEAIPGSIINRKEGKKETVVIIESPGDPSNTEDWPRQFDWISRQVVLFDRVFRQLVKELP